MRKLLIISLSALFLLGLTRRNELFQVISQHPEELVLLNAYTETVSLEGRLWIVRLKGEAPSEILHLLRPVGTQRLESQLLSLRKSRTNPQFAHLLEQVESERIRQDVIALSGHKNRSAGHADNRRALRWVEERLRSLGLSPREMCYRPNQCSLLAEQRGEKNAKVVLIVAHMDSVGEDFAGADDNASGTAALLEIARILSTRDTHNTIRYFVTNGEENGLLGSTHYARQLEARQELNQIKFSLNMDMVGYNANGIVELETNAPHENLANHMAQLVATYTTLRPKVTLGAWGSDHVPFLDRGVPSLLTIEDWSTKTPCYHQKCDTPDTLNYVYAAEIVKLNVATILSLDRVDL